MSDEIALTFLKRYLLENVLIYTKKLVMIPMNIKLCSEAVQLE